MSVTSADFVRRFGTWQDRAKNETIFVTHHGRCKHVMLSLATYEELVAEQRGQVSAASDSARLETMITQLDGGFVALDKEMVVTEINPAACLFFRVTRPAVLGRALGEELPELQHSVVRAHLARAVAAGEVTSCELPAVSHPGEWLRCTVFPYGEGAACLLRNITSDQHARTNFQHQEALNQALHATGQIACARLSVRGTFTFVEPDFAAMVGLVPEALEQVRLTDILPVARRSQAASHLDAVLGGGAPHGFDTVLLVNDAAELPVRIGLAPLRRGHAIDGATVVARSLR
ncbi:PAS domain-containing protein [Sphingomonas jatrophae]|uniref:PAS domain-containing protein n=1 Tax=Sphingomonas jatrophae TaxID=1166337 RepID=UPI0013F4BE0E|nr:PAS domain-containing protein [Sphingomonas jatrophae]